MAAQVVRLVQRSERFKALQLIYDPVVDVHRSIELGAAMDNPMSRGHQGIAS